MNAQDAEYWANIVTVVGLPVSILGLIIAVVSLRNQLIKSNEILKNTFEVINLQSKYFSKGVQTINNYYATSRFTMRSQIGKIARERKKDGK